MGILRLHLGKGIPSIINFRINPIKSITQGFQKLAYLNKIIVSNTVDVGKAIPVYRVSKST